MKAIKRKGKPRAWTEDELKAVNDCYHQMLYEQREGRKFVKKHEIERMMAGTQMDRTYAAVECRLMNISGIRHDMGWDIVKGYAPLSNVGKKIRDTLMPYIESYQMVMGELNALQSGDSYQIHKASQWEEEKGIG